MSAWRRARPIVLAVSVALNLAVLSMWGAQAIPARLHAQSIAGPGQSDIWCPLHRELGVSEAQWRQIEPGLLEFHEEAQANCLQLQKWRDECLKLVASPEPDMAAIHALQLEVLAGQGRMQGLVLKQLLAEKRVLTPAQQEQLFSLIHKSMQCAGHAGLMGSAGMHGMGATPGVGVTRGADTP
jgi:Spy/CpxP family protein refolding chaperone